MSTKKISRRDFLKVAGISAAAIGLTACGGSSSTVASTTGSAGSAAASAESATFSVTEDVTGDRAPYVERFAELISDKTGGRYQANVIAAGSLGNGSDMAQMLQMGTLDVLMSDDMTIDGVLDGALGFAWLPGLVTRRINTTSRAGSPTKWPRSWSRTASSASLLTATASVRWAISSAPSPRCLTWPA